MKTFTVYYHPGKGFEAVREGFSWPGFFLTWIWAFFKGLAPVGWWLFVAWLTAQLLILSGEPTAITLAVSGTLAAVLLAGFKGNHWRRSALDRQGYRLVDAVHAESPQAAVTKSRREQGLE